MKTVISHILQNEVLVFCGTCWCGRPGLLADRETHSTFSCYRWDLKLLISSADLFTWGFHSCCEWSAHAFYRGLFFCYPLCGFFHVSSVYQWISKLAKGLSWDESVWNRRCQQVKCRNFFVETDSCCVALALVHPGYWKENVSFIRCWKQILNSRGWLMSTQSKCSCSFVRVLGCL